MPDMRKLIDLCENAIHPITDWTSKKSIAMTLVELRRVVLSVKKTALVYQSLYGDDASGSGDLLHVVSEFENQFMICHPVVNSLTEGPLMDIISDLTRERDLLDVFLGNNMLAFNASTLSDGELKKLFAITERLITVIDTAITKIREVVLYRYPE